MLDRNLPSQQPPPPSRRRAEQGFTLIELIMVVVIMGALAIYAVPRMFSSNEFNARGFHDETLAYLRYAQKTAIAQRRTVCVAFASNSVTLTISAAAATFNCAAPSALTGPKGESPVVLTAKTGINYVATPTAFNFNGLGQPITSAGAASGTQSFQVTGAGKTITVETGSGYVHE